MITRLESIQVGTGQPFIQVSKLLSEHKRDYSLIGEQGKEGRVTHMSEGREAQDN